MAGPVQLRVDSAGRNSIDAYLEYKRIVGDDDRGKLFSNDEYEAYKKRVIPIRMNNRLFVAWVNTRGLYCKQVGPQTNCFCGHRYVQHFTDLETIPQDRPIKIACDARNCGCKAYCYVPQGAKCSCKHAARDHDCATQNCTKPQCKCTRVRATVNCSCGEAAHMHQTLVETKQERVAKGIPVGQNMPFKAMGGLTGFSSLADGASRYDPSGLGALPDEELAAPITHQDHHFLRQHARALEPASREAASQVRGANESELDYYERRYQEREKQSMVYRPKPRKQ